jgi:hypothetical protein
MLYAKVMLKFKEIFIYSDSTYLGNENIGTVVALYWTCFAAAEIRRHCMQLWPSSDDDANESSSWGAVLTSFPRTFLSVVVVIGWEGRRTDASRHWFCCHEFVQSFG